MRIESPEIVTDGQKVRVSARVVWEDSERPPQEIYFAVDESFAEALSPFPDAFLVAALLPAVRHREKRVRVEAPICPEVWDGLEVVMAWMHNWYGPERTPIPIEAQSRSRQLSRPAGRAACMFTGGVDSTATVRHNRLRFPINHPSAITDALVVCGLEVGSTAAFGRVLQALLPVARDAQMTMIPVYSNVRSLDEDWLFWRMEWQGAVYSSVGHALSRRVSEISVGATYDIPHLLPHGSHPLIDYNYGSSALRVRHDGLARSRFAKVKLIAGWETALRHLRVCNDFEHYRPLTVNCGECEKCMRTMLALLALRVLDKTDAFPSNDLDVESVRRIAKIYSPALEAAYEELVGPLTDCGRDDLAICIREKLARRRGEVGWRGQLRRVDRVHLGGRLTSLKRVFVPSKSAALLLTAAYGVLWEAPLYVV